MKNTNYKRGAIYERKTRQILEEKFGCFWSCRTAGSKTCLDCLGISKAIIYAIQVKSTTSTKTRKPKKQELEDLQNISQNKGVIALLFVFERGKLRIYDADGKLIRRE